MTSTDENVRLLSNAVLSDVRGDADRILAEARQKAGQIRQRAREQADEERKRILEQAAAEAARFRGQASASTQLKVRTLQLEQREKLLQAVFDAARQKLAGVQQSSDYEKTAHLLLAEALTQLGAPVVRVRADKVTRKLLTPALLEKLSKDRQIEMQLAEALETGTGVIVETEDGRRRFDNTLENRLKRMQASLRSPVHRILMGEAR